VYSVCFFSSWPMSKDIRPFGSSVVTSVLFIPDVPDGRQHVCKRNRPKLRESAPKDRAASMGPHTHTTD
jgi:hypothetical protein